jgi:SAM-dependent methyltransferase
LNSSKSCASCGDSRLDEVVVFEGLPVHVGVLWSTAEAAADCPTGTMRLVYCPSCGLLSNAAFDESLLDYTLEYDNSLHASEVFRSFEASLVDDLVRRHGLEHRRIVEVGGGDGRFLRLLCEAGDNRGLGFDPSARVDSESADGRVLIRAEYFGQDTQLESFDLLCCRQVLEHVPDLAGFMSPIASAMEDQPGASAYFDVPNSMMLLADLSIWDLVYEHCHYFVDVSLDALMRTSGLEPTRTWASFGDQFLSMELRYGAGPGEASSASADSSREGSPEALAVLVREFAGHARRRGEEWRERLHGYSEAGMKVALWGAGARAVTFLAMLDVTDEVAYLVDSNSRKQGTFMAGSAHAIHPPQHLLEEPVDRVVLLNGIYREEIATKLKELGSDAELVVA